MVAVASSQVIVVGGGPVGLGLAIDLAQRGVASIVVEQETSPPPIPKGQNLTQRTMELFRAWGVEAAIREARKIPRDQPIAGMTAYGNLLSGFAHPWHRRELVRDYYAAENERLPQYETERVLRERVAALPAITLLTGWRATSIVQRASDVQVTIRSGNSGEEKTIDAGFVAGCDGSRSLTRAECGIELDTQDHEKRMALVLFRSSDLHAKLSRYPGCSYYNVLTPELDGYWRFFGRIDASEGFFFHAPVPAHTTNSNFDFGALLNESVGADIDADIYYVGFWDLRFATARSYRSGRILLAGDAAHSHPPYGGYGINTGLEDARNLAWKLAAAIAGWGTDGLLDSYTAERRPVFESTARDFIKRYIDQDRAFLRRYSPTRDPAEFARAWDGRVSAAETDIQTYEPNYAGSPIVSGPGGASCSAVGRHAFAARAGHHIAPQPLSGGGNVFDALGPGFTLLALDGDESVVDEFAANAAVMNLPLSLLRDDRANGRARYQARYILVRPDDYVAWCGDDAPPDIAKVLSIAIGRAPATGC